MFPREISHYRVLKLLGQGGMGQVYLAEDTILNRKVAIKSLTPGSVDDDRARSRLVREAQAAAALDHPNICHIYEVVEAENDCFIVMQYLEGETLDRIILTKKLELSEALGFAIDIVDALAEAHGRGIVHRDIKPQNLMITPRGQVKVLDFGLAKMMRAEWFADSDARTMAILSNPGTMIGTMPYMSPEQVRAEDVDGRSDIFSFGTVLFEMLTGKQPFANPNGAVTISAVLTHDPPPLRQCVPNAPVELERILQKCLAKDRGQRYQSASELAGDLRQLQRIAALGAVTLESGIAPRVTTSVPRSMTRIVPAVLVSVLIIAAGIYFLRTRVKTGSNARQISSVAVLPFVNTSADANMEYLSDGITDSLINSLSRLPNLKLVGRTSVFRYKGRDADARTVGSELGVESVLTGRIVEHGNELSITTELVDARDNSHIWGEQYNRPVSDILAIQEDITSVITEKLRLEISHEDKERLTKRYTDNSEAYQLYLRGRYFWNKRTEADIKKGIEYFQKAIEADPNYALAYTGMSDSYALLGSGGFDTMLPDEAMPKAREAAQRALEIDDTLAEAHTSLAYVKFIYDWDWATADSEFKRSTELNPNYATAHHLRSLYLLAMDRKEESILESRRAQELDPLSLSININVGRTLLFAGQYDRAIEQLRRTLEIDPNYVWAHYLAGLAYEQKGMFAEAISELQQVKALSGDSPISEAALAHSYALSGKRPEAIKIADDLKARSRKTHIPPYYLAIVYAGLNDREQTLDWLEKAYHERTNQMAYLKVEPAFDKLRADTSFQALLRRVGL